MTYFIPSPNNLNDKSSLVERYFWDGFQYSVIMDFMSDSDKINMSLRSLHRILRARGLHRRGRSINMQDIMTVIMDQGAMSQTKATVQCTRLLLEKDLLLTKILSDLL